MQLKQLYNEIQGYIAKLDFSKLWRGFKPLKFALYTENECFFDGAYITKSNDFLANTAIFYNGEWIAIWNVQEEMDTVALTSKIIHEMFHAFQSAHNESRFFDDVEALYHYRYNEENISLKIKENQLLDCLSSNFNETNFKEFLQIRKYRFETFRYEYHYESCVEQIEGTANYVELQCLKQLSAELFEKKLSAIKKAVATPNNLLPIRAVCYNIGALLLYIMAENNIPFDDGFVPLPFSENVLDGVQAKKPVLTLTAKELLDNFHASVDKTIGDAIAKNSLVTDKPHQLLAINTYNPIFYNNYIISTYFVMFGDESNPQIEYGDFVIQTSAYKKADKIYRM